MYINVVQAIDAAKAAGVQLIVLLSVAGAQYEAITFGKEFRLNEKHLEASGVKWVTLRAAAFQENALGATQFIKQGIYGQPLGDDPVKARYAPVAISDVGTSSFIHFYLCSLGLHLQILSLIF
jgi:uncharacterized protein YbjT (DUF2867 family)